jgi:hypothetical protein
MRYFDYAIEELFSVLAHNSNGVYTSIRRRICAVDESAAMQKHTYFAALEQGVE